VRISNELNIPAGPGRVANFRTRDPFHHDSGESKLEEEGKMEFESSTGRQITEGVEEDFFKDRFLNSRKRRSSLKKRSLPNL
jgi:hypothetical protein